MHVLRCSGMGRSSSSSSSSNLYTVGWVLRGVPTLLMESAEGILCDMFRRMCSASTRHLFASGCVVEVRFGFPPQVISANVLPSKRPRPYTKESWHLVLRSVDGHGDLLYMETFADEQRRLDKDVSYEAILCRATHHTPSWVKIT